VSGLVLEGFAGSGGLSTGLALLGYRDAIGVELDWDACRTAVAAGHRRVRADVAAFPLDHLAGRVDGVVMSPPCQAWSKAGRRLGLLDQPRILAHLDAVSRADRWVGYDSAGWHDERSPLVLQPVRWVDALRPRWVALEQVPDVLPFWRALARWLRGVGYSAVCGLLSAEQFGVPQTRQRAFLVARNDGAPARLPSPSHARYVPTRRAGEPAADGLFDEPARERAVRPADRALLPWVSMADALGIDAGQRVNCASPFQETPQFDPSGRPCRTLTHKSRSWTLETEQRSDTAAGRVPITRDSGQPSPTLVANADRWELHPSGRDRAEDRTIPRPLDAPSMTVAFGHSDMRFVYRNGNQDHSAVRDQDEPAPTVHFAARQRVVDWVIRTNQVPGGASGYQRRDNTEPSPTVNGQGRSLALERPATAVCGDPRLPGPGHRDCEGGQRQYDEHTVRVDVWQAGVLQGFPADYPWRGTRTAQFRQVGDAVPPPLAAAVLGELLDVDWRARLWGAA
jgi:DNA (cytosine-5)-methyltransferase 1